LPAQRAGVQETLGGKGIPPPTPKNPDRGFIFWEIPQIHWKNTRYGFNDLFQNISKIINPDKKHETPRGGVWKWLYLSFPRVPGPTLG